MGVDCAARPAGFLNDLAVMVGENGIVPDTISCPTLILHDREDPVVPFAHAEWSHRCIPESRLLDIRVGGHLIWYGDEARLMQQQREAFIDASFGG